MHGEGVELGVIEAPAEQADRLVDEVGATMEAIRERHQGLAEGRGHRVAAEAELLDLMQRRDELLCSLGRIVSDWRAAGGRLQWLQAGQAGEGAASPRDAQQPEAGAEGAMGERGACDARGSLAVAKEEAVARADPPTLDEPADEDAPVESGAPLDSPPVSQAALNQLVQKGLRPNWSSDNPMARRQRELGSILDRIGAPSCAASRAEANRTVEALAAAVREMDGWLQQPREVQHSLLALVSSLARHLQEEQEPPVAAPTRARLDALFPQMARWSARHRPGYVRALARRNSPDAGSWLADAKKCWDRLRDRAPDAAPQARSPRALLRDLEQRMKERKPRGDALVSSVRAVLDAGVPQSDPNLVSMLLPHRDDFKGVGGLKTLKSQLRDAERALEAERMDAEGTEVEEQRIPPDWSWFHHTRGKVAVIVGGDDRGHAAERIREAFEFSSVEWESGAPRRAAALADRVKAARSVDMIILLRRFVSHKFTDTIVPACKESDVALVFVDHGYGVTQVRLAVERFLNGHQR